MASRIRGAVARSRPWSRSRARRSVRAARRSAGGWLVQSRRVTGTVAPPVHDLEGLGDVLPGDGGAQDGGAVSDVLPGGGEGVRVGNAAKVKVPPG